MRFLADAGISPRTVAFLHDLGHDAVHVRTLGLQRAQDPDLVRLAQSDSRIILTFDLDVGEILALGVHDRPSVILFRLVDERPDAVNARLAVVIPERIVDLEAGALILVETATYRVRRLPIGRPM